MKWGHIWGEQMHAWFHPLTLIWIWSGFTLLADENLTTASLNLGVNRPKTDGCSQGTRDTTHSSRVNSCIILSIPRQLASPSESLFIFIWIYIALSSVCPLIDNFIHQRRPFIRHKDIQLNIHCKRWLARNGGNQCKCSWRIKRREKRKGTFNSLSIDGRSLFNQRSSFSSTHLSSHVITGTERQRKERVTHVHPFFICKGEGPSEGREGQTETREENELRWLNLCHTRVMRHVPNG